MAGPTGIEQMKQRTGLAPSGPKTLASLMDTLAPRLQKVAARHMNADRLLNIALNMTKDPKIAACTQSSLLGCVMMSAISGLEPGVFGQCYYIPYGNTLTFVPGWQGYADLVARTGRGEAWTGAVYEGDEFSYALGSKPHLEHTPSGELTEADTPRGRALLYCYAVGYVKGSERPILEVWSKAKITAHRDRYNKVGAKHYSFANLSNFEMYGRKVCFLQVIKYLPKSAEIQQVATLDYAADAGIQALTPEAALDGNLPELPQDTTEQAKTTPFDEAFAVLGWNAEEQANYLVDMAKFTPAQIKADLNRRVDERDAQERGAE